MTASQTRGRLGGNGVVRGPDVGIEIDGVRREAHAGETVAGVLVAEGIQTFRTTTRRSLPRGIYCGMGVCYDCLVTVDGRYNVRACMTYVKRGMKVSTQVERDVKKPI